MERRSLEAGIPVGWIVAWLALGGLSVSIVNDLRGVSATTPADWPTLVFEGVILALIVAQCRRHGVRIRNLLGPPVARLRDAIPMLAGPCFLIASLGSQSLLAAAVLPEALLRSQSAAALTSFLPTSDAPGRLVLAVAMLLVIGPIFEELLFRRILLDRWTHLFNARIAQLLSIGTFALLHGRIVWALCLGTLLTILYVRSGTLWISIGAHSLSNAAALVWAAVTRLSTASQTGPRSPSDLVLHGTIMLTLGLAGLVLIFVRFLPSAVARLPNRPVDTFGASE